MTAPNRPRHRSRSYGQAIDYDRNDGLPGVVYVLYNEAMRHGLFKIGQSTRSGAHRASDLNRTVGTETPKMFVCIFEARTVDCGRAEKAVHKRLDTFRLTRQEYFEVDLDFAKQVILEECAKHTPATVAESNLRELQEARKTKPVIRPQRLVEQDISNAVGNARSAWLRAVEQRYKPNWRIKAFIAAISLGVLLSGILWATAFIHSFSMNALLVAFVVLTSYEMILDRLRSKYHSSADAVKELSDIEDEARASYKVRLEQDESKSRPTGMAISTDTVVTSFALNDLIHSRPSTSANSYVSVASSIVDETQNSTATVEQSPSGSEVQSSEKEVQILLNQNQREVDKNFAIRYEFTEDQKQKLLPIVTRLVDAAFRLGYTKFKDAAKYVLDRVSAALGQKFADAISLETLQGAYIHISSIRPNAETVAQVAKVTNRSDLESHSARTLDEHIERQDADGPSVVGKEQSNSQDKNTDSIPLDIFPIDNTECELAANIDDETVNQMPPGYAYGAVECDFCKRPAEQMGLFVDGVVRGGFQWANMCANCFHSKGTGIGEGKGQLYAKQRNGTWRLVGGFESE